jgi:hypothetical protein
MNGNCRAGPRPLSARRTSAVGQVLFNHSEPARNLLGVPVGIARPPPRPCCSADLRGCALSTSITWRRRSLESAKFG